MNYIQDAVKSVGGHTDSVTLKKVSESGVNKWGDATDVSVEEEKVTAIVEVLSGESEEVAEGDFESGDIVAYIDDSQDGVSDDNIIVYQGKEYRVEEVLKMEVGHEAHFEARASRV